MHLEVKMKDYLVRGIVESKNCRVFACTTKQLLEVARQKHDLWPTASATLGRFMSATFMLAAMNKNHEKMTVTINGGGPIGTMMAVTRGDGHIKGFVGDPHVHYTYNDTGHLAVGVAVGTQGTLQVIRDMGLKEPYVGQTILVSSEIAEDLTYYFANSEQVPSSVGLGVLMEKDNTVKTAGGFIIQMMPFAEEKTIAQIEENLKNVTSVTSLLEKGYTPENLLEELLGNTGLEITDTIPTQFYCNCSKERVEQAIVSIGRKEIQKMIEDGETIEVKCHFCNSAYHYTVEDLKAIIKRSK